MQLVEQGKIDLDSDINNYISMKYSGLPIIYNPYFPNYKINLRHLLTHTGSTDQLIPILIEPELKINIYKDH